MYVKLIKVSGTYSYVFLCNQFVMIGTFALWLAIAEQHNVLHISITLFKDIFKREKKEKIFRDCTILRLYNIIYISCV